MNKKKFPKAVLRTAAEMRETSASQATAGQPVESMHSRAAPTRSDPSGKVVEMLPRIEAAEFATTAKTDSSSDAARLRRRLAVAIVERYANLAAVGGVIPVPIANATALTALMVRMIHRLSRLYGVPFERNRVRAAVIGLMGGVLPAGFAAIATSTLTYFLPGYGLLSLAVSSVTSSAYARGIGQLFIEHFENGASQVDFRSIILR